MPPRQPASLSGRVPIDEERIRIAPDAPIENAVKFTGKGDRITLAATGEDGQAIIQVSDTGPGISPDKQCRVFDRFARPDEARVRSNGGTGLGLAIVKAIAEAHGGPASLRCGAGPGASFKITLPGFEPSWSRGR